MFQEKYPFPQIFLSLAISTRLLLVAQFTRDLEKLSGTPIFKMSFSGKEHPVLKCAFQEHNVPK